MSEYLVLTAMGPERTESVSDLTKLASECGCNIIDSRMAIFGMEFTLIMLLHGTNKAIYNLENKLPAIAHKLGLITMMKRTSGYREREFVHHYQANYAGIDQPGILKSVTAFFSSRKIDVSSLKSEINPKTNHMSASLLIALTKNTSIEALEHDFVELCEQFNVQGCIKEVQSNLF